MSVSFINDGEQLALYDRASGMAFGPIISGPEQVEKAEAFIAWFADGQAAEAWGAVPGVTPIWSWPHKGQPQPTLAIGLARRSASFTRYGRPGTLTTTATWSVASRERRLPRLCR